MNTLGKNTTSRLFATENGYTELQSRWSRIMQNPVSRKALTSTHHILYALLMGRDWRKGFTVPKNWGESSLKPRNVLSEAVYAARAISASPSLCSYVLGEPGVNNVRPWVPTEPVPNPFYGLLSADVFTLLSELTPKIGYDEYLPVAAYQEVQS